ncbi:MAG: molybdenum cofactor biosynthesis protein MoaE [Proteobacteria bacterium]|nr:molybdenum cofactor biosynthesis protein MoaE [Pseudomonadota bacterium]
MKIEIKTEAFDPLVEQQRYQASLDIQGKYGATAVFIGTMRDFNEGDIVKSMTLDYYPGMTEKHLQQICNTAAERWSLLDSLVIHRVGVINIGDPIVLVAVWSVHRGDAFDACRFIMEDLKAKAPFWKKEELEDGERWVEKNTSGYSKI